jgi:site-specific DNA-methyltransferase (adenine-specific)
MTKTLTSIIQGDCHDVIPTLDMPPINCLLTDPPYGMAYQSTYGKDPLAREQYQDTIEGDETAEVAIERFDATMDLIIPRLADTAELYIFCTWTVGPEWQVYLRSLATKGIDLMQLIIWEKGYPGLGDFTYNWGCGHEFIYYLKKGRRVVPYRRSGILHFDKVRPGTNIHPTQKPVELLRVLIEYSTDPGEFVFDPYVGSGSTVVAAMECNREAIGIEKKPAYAKDAKERVL